MEIFIVSSTRMLKKVSMMCALFLSIFIVVHVPAQEAMRQVLDGGSLRGMTILSADDGEYVDVTGPVTVERDSSLTISKGLILCFQPGSGIHSVGRLRIEGTENDPVILRSKDSGNTWEGLHISGSSIRGSILQHVSIEGPTVGVKVTAGASLKARDVTVKSAENAGMLFEDSTDVELYNCNIAETPQESCGICVIGGRNFKVDGCEIDRGAGHTIGIQARGVNNLSIQNCQISSGSALGMNLVDVFGNVKIEDSRFSTNIGGSFIQTDMNRNSVVSIDRIRFSSLGFSGHCLKIVSLGNLDGAVSVTNSVIYGCDKAVDLTADNKSVTVTGNQMYLNHQALELSVSHKQTRVDLSGNTFIYNTNDDRTPAVNVKILPQNFEGSIQIYNNLFQQNQCKFTFQAINVLPCGPEMRLSIFDNKFVLNSMDPQVTGDKAVVMLKLAAVSDHFTFANNTFENPATQYDLAVGATSIDYGYVLDASRNFWDSSRKSILQVEERVLANHLDPSRAVVLMEPFILSLEPYVLSSTCEDSKCDCPSGYGGPYCQESYCLDVQNCTGHGDCIAPNACKCEAGWTGLSCDKPVCLVDCAHGTCFASDVCNCSEGWEGEKCDVPVCTSNCSNHGTCGSIGECVCDKGWTGISCENATCLSKSNCTDHGGCVEVDVCDCSPGWTGEDCSVPECPDLQGCNDKGNCSLNQTCICLPGWYGDSCIEPDCSKQMNCSDHGRCVEPNSCECNKRYAGESCYQCDEHFWGRDCLPCPECQQGTCHKEGFCTCEGPNWTGSLCDRCSESFYGPSCLPLPSITELLPNAGPTSGGTVVHVNIDNLPNSTFTCRFAGEEVMGVAVDESTVKCTSPPHMSGMVTFNLSGDNVTVLSSVNFTYYGDCPRNFCGEDEDPSHGVCMLGACACNPPWSGRNCSILQQAPDIAKVSALMVREFQDFTYQFELLEGTEPVSWSVESNISRIRLDPNDGTLAWESPELDIKSSMIIVSIHNSIGSDSETVQLKIKPVYKVTSLYMDQNGPFSSPKPVTLSGDIESYILGNETLPRSFPVLIRIKHRNLTRTLETTADSTSLKFEKTFYPSPSDMGKFTADACHPSETDFTEPVSWVVMGLRISPKTLTLRGSVGERLSGAITLDNLGLDRLTDLKYFVEDNSTSVDVAVMSADRSDIYAGDTMVTELNPLQPLELNLTIQVDLPGNFSLTVSILSSEGINAYLLLDLVIEELGPVLELSPNEVNSTMLRGKERTFEIRIKNTGSKTAHNLNTQVSSSDLVFVLAFDKLDVEDFDYVFLDLEPGKSAILMVLVAPVFEHEIGLHRERIVVESTNVQSTLWVNTYVLSDLSLNITILVTDDTKCDSDVNSRLKMAVVHLSNKARNFRLEETTNDFGELVIADLQEDYYELSVTAPNHQPTTQVIFVTPDNDRVTIQLKTIAVNLSWAISEDRLADDQIYLQSDFRLNSSFPVLTVEPNILDLDALEQGETNVINLRLDNHGLASAKDVTFVLPQNHPLLTFTMTSVKFGELPANESTMAVIEVTRKSMDNKTRSISQMSEFEEKGSDFHLLIKIKYSHSCIELIDREVDVIVMRSGNQSAEDPDVPELVYSIPLVQSVFCDSCLFSVSQCLESIRLSESWRDCSLGVFGRIEQDPEQYGNAIGQFMLLLELFFSCGKVPGQSHQNKTENRLNFGANSTIEFKSTVCLKDVNRDCHDKILHSLELPPERKRQNLAPIAAYRRLVIQELYELHQYMVPQSWYNLSDSNWFREEVNPVLSINGDGGMLVTEAELVSVLQARTPPGLTSLGVEDFLLTLNTSLFNWQTGDLDAENGSLSYSEISSSVHPFFKGLDQMLKDGFSDPLTWYSESLKDIQRASKAEASCAKAKLRLSKITVEANQSLSVTLEIDNGDISSLLDLVLKLQIYREEDDTDSDDLFKTEVGLSQGFEFGEDNSTIVLPLGSWGSQTWKVTPFELSALTGSDRYRIHARIEHALRGETLNVSIRGEVFTVTASPRMEVHYFHPRFPLERLYPRDNNQTISPKISAVVKNIGSSLIRDLKIVSSKLTILTGKSDLVQRCRILKASVDTKVVSSMYELSLGDLEPGSIVLANWYLQCDQPANIRQFELSFIQTNVMGDAILCIPEREYVHEVLHEVRVDNPDDDRIEDQLVIHRAKNVTYPDQVISTNKDLSSSSVSSTEEYELHEIVRNDERTELQMLVQAYREGWNWIQIPYNLPVNQELKKVRRQDSKNLILQYNVWLTETDDQRYINLFDWFATPSWDVRRKRQATSFNSYYLELGIKNKPPTFTKQIYLVSVSENLNLKATILTCPAFDEDNEVTYYELEETGKESIPFGVTEFGEIVLIGGLDRETEPVYRLKLTAYDNGEPTQSATTAIGITVMDENDNDPVFKESPYSITIQNTVPVNTEILKIRAFDPDEGENGTVVYSIEVSEPLPFIIDRSTGAIFISELLSSQGFAFAVSASNGNGSKATTAQVVINVIHAETVSKIFKDNVTKVSIAENLSVAEKVVQIFSSTNIPNGEVKFEFLSDVPFQLNISSGYVEVKSALDRETRDFYNFTIRAKDDSPFLEEIDLEEIVVLINVTDINDNSPSFTPPDIRLSVKENTQPGKVIQTISFSDPDFGINGTLADCKFVDHDDEKEAQGYFGLNTTSEGVEIYLINELDREKSSHIRVELLAEDGGEPSLTGNVTVNIIVEDVNDNPPVFKDTNIVLNISKQLPINSKLLTVRATDDDINSSLSYRFNDTSGSFEINRDTGVVTLSKSLEDIPDLEFQVLTIVSDEIHEAHTTVTFLTSQNNVFAPVFEKELHRVDVKETAAPGTFVEILYAEDADGDWFTYFILDGDPEEMFHLDSVSGEIMTQYPLDFAESANFTLTIGARDGKEGDARSRIGYTTVEIRVIKVNEFAPSFPGGETTQVDIDEDSPIGSIFKFQGAIDEDNDDVTYSFVDEEERFSIGPVTAEISVLILLDREITETYRLRVTATDNGVPARSVEETLVICITDVNDNPPFISDLDKNVTILQTAVRLHVPVYQVSANDPDKGNNSRLSYILITNTLLLEIREATGAIFCTEACLDINQNLTFELTIKVTDNGIPQRETQAATTFNIIAFPLLSGMNDTTDLSDDGSLAEPEPEDYSLSTEMMPTPSLPYQSSTDFHDEETATSETVFDSTTYEVSLDSSTGTLEFATSEATTDDMTSETTLGPSPEVSEDSDESSETYDTDDDDESSEIDDTDDDDDHDDTIENTTEMLTTLQISPKPLPTPELPLDQYIELCQNPIDAIMEDRAGIFFFQENYVWKLPQKRRWVVRGYPKRMSRVFAGWRRKKIQGPITAAVHSEDVTYLFKGATVWIFESYRLVDITPITGPGNLTQVDAAIFIPGNGIYLIQGTSAYELIEGEDEIKADNPMPLQTLLPGAPSPIDGAFTSFDQNSLFIFSNRLVYEWNVTSEMFSMESPYHITKWMKCVDE